MQGNLLVEMFPLISFFAAYYVTKNIFSATLSCIIASWLQVAFYRLRYRKINKTTWISTLLITVLGWLTITMHNKLFVMLKPSILYWIFAAALYVSAKMGNNWIR